MCTNNAKFVLNIAHGHIPYKRKLHRIFNRNSLEMSYSYIKNVKSIISNYDSRVPTEVKCTVVIISYTRQNGEAYIRKLSTRDK